MDDVSMENITLRNLVDVCNSVPIEEAIEDFVLPVYDNGSSGIYCRISMRRGRKIQCPYVGDSPNQAFCYECSNPKFLDYLKEVHEALEEIKKYKQLEN